MINTLTVAWIILKLLGCYVRRPTSHWHAQMLQFLFMIIDIDRNGMDNWEPTDAVSIFGMFKMFKEHK